MAKVRSITELQQALDESSAYRKRELTAVRSVAEERRELGCRLAVCLLYAHLEGFIKQASDLYVAYVRHLGLHQHALCLPLASLALREKLIAGPIERLKALQLLLDDKSEKQQLPNSPFSRESNLGDGTYRRILQLVGLDTPDLVAFEGFVNDLTAMRHDVAHGGLSPVAPDFIESSTQHVVRIIDLYSIGLSSAASTLRFRRTV